MRDHTTGYLCYMREAGVLVCDSVAGFSGIDQEAGTHGVIRVPLTLVSCTLSLVQY